ncbi:MAG: translation initiation factor IF-2 [Candidatus Aenigmatarchaeota archaeon]
MQQIRSPIVTVLAHVDHGKTTLLDAIRHTTIATGEAGGITQLISTTKVPIEKIRDVAGQLIDKFKVKTDIPGLLFIDTPGHAAFTTMRQRGGAIADIAILLIDINEGIEPQTHECMDILKNIKTPFVVVINKIDKMQGWKKQDATFLSSFAQQNDDVKGDFEKRFYEILESLEMCGFPAERYDRVTDFTKKVAVVPISAKTGEGIPDLLMVLIGVAQRFLKDQLILTEESDGMILEVKESEGLGTTIDAVVSDGVVHKNDYLIVAGKIPVITKIRALLEPRPMKDIRSEKSFMNVDSVVAAAGVRIAAPALSEVVAGNRFKTTSNEEDAQKILQSFMIEQQSVEIEKDEEGLVLRADTIGSLEALEKVFSSYPIRSAAVGAIKKETIMECEANKDPFMRIVIGFNAKPSADAESIAKEKEISILSNNIIYRLIEDYEIWTKETKKFIEQNAINVVTRPAKFRLLPGFVFRANNPAICGCEVQSGLLKPNVELMNASGKSIGNVKQLQKENKNAELAKPGDRVAVSITGPTIGRQIKENEILYTDIPSSEYKVLKEHSSLLSDSERRTLEEIFEIKKKLEKLYGF